MYCTFLKLLETFKK